MVRNRLSENVTNVEWAELFTQIADQLNDAQVSSAVTAVQSAQVALEANAVPQLTLEVLMLDLPWVDPTMVTSLKIEEDDDTG